MRRDNDNDNYNNSNENYNNYNKEYYHILSSNYRRIVYKPPKNRKYKNILGKKPKIAEIIFPYRSCLLPFREPFMGRWDVRMFPGKGSQTFCQWLGVANGRKKVFRKGFPERVHRHADAGVGIGMKMGDSEI